jgi:hypothetical protein
MSSVTELVPGFLIEDLANSGLEPQDVRARVAGPSEKSATNTPQGVDAYALPYFDMYGKVVPFYRVKLINSPDPKIRYKQLATAANHVYFPPGFQAALRGARCLIITEGEKKAAAAVKAGFAACALGGVDSWRSRTIVLSKDATVGTNKSGAIVAKLPAGKDVHESTDTLAKGLSDVIDYAIKKKLPIVICFDTDLDIPDFINYEVQRAAATLGYELRFRGVPFNSIRQLILRPNPKLGLTGKMGLDDWLVHEELGADALEEVLSTVLSQRQAFPRHPNPREYVNRKLQRINIPRSELQALATAVTSELDAEGIRLYCPLDDNMYYFDETNFKLMRVEFSNQMSFSRTPIGIKLYNDFGLSSADVRLLSHLNAQFCGEQPIQNVKPEKVVTCRGDNIYYQLSDGLMVRVNRDEIKLLHNGQDDVLFEAEMVKPVPHMQLMELVAQYQQEKTPPNYWYDVLKEARIKESPNDQTRKLLSLLYSISPWLYRWRGTQLPVEQMLGEAGSGKSTLYSLRLRILTGISVLRNAPNDIRDWTASIAFTGGLHVTDNVHMPNSRLKQELSDELCRIITEPEPHIERRKLYTDNQIIRTPVKCVFAITAIKQPFVNTDIIQRSVIAELDKGTGEVEYEADWETAQLNRWGGRTQWIAHQLVFLQRMFQLIDKEWQNSYKARFRLINVEQLLMFAARIYGEESTWIPQYLELQRDASTAKADSALEGLAMWAEEVRVSFQKKNNPQGLKHAAFTALDMVSHFEGDDEFERNTVLTNARSLGRYLVEHKHEISHIAGIVPAGRKKNNRELYHVIELPDDPTN